MNPIELLDIKVNRKNNLNIKNTDLIAMCELKVIFKGNTVMEDVVRVTTDRESVKLYGMLGETRTIRGRLIDVNLTKQEAVIAE